MYNAMMIGERVYLRPFETADAETLAQIAATETDTFMYRGRKPFSPLAYEHDIGEAYKGDYPPWIAFIVALRSDDRCIGLVGADGIDYLHGTAETYSALGPAEFRSQGYGTEAKRLLLEYCFDHLHLHVLRSSVFEANTRSVAALLKQGYREAGRLKWADVKGGRYHDNLLFDITRDEWRAAYDAWRAR
ncbi:MAG: GNAT family N-acetyltransferase [Chloroflexota bacterium]|nr:GNAT family N-acetyltransferase [Chloroflexota bacterium]